MDAMDTFDIPSLRAKMLAHLGDNSDAYPRQTEQRFPRILAGANPGNVGHLFVKRTFVDGTDTYEIRDMEPGEGGMKRQFIPALRKRNFRWCALRGMQPQQHQYTTE